MLLETVEHIRNVIAVSQATTYENLFSHLFSVEQKYIHPLIEGALYNKLLEFLKNPDSVFLTYQEVNPDFSDNFLEELSSKELAYARLLFVTQRAIIHLAYFEGFDVLNAYISDAGFKRSETDNMKSLFKYQEDNIRNYYKETGFDGLDFILSFLEKNITHFPEFTPTLSKLKSRVIPNTATFNTTVSILNSRLVFMRLQPAIKSVEDINLPVIMGRANATILMNGLVAATRPPKITNILPYIQPIVALLASALLMEESGADLTDRGLYFQGNKGGSNMNDVKMPSPQNRITELAARNRKLADSYTIELHRHMAANPDDWSSFTNPRAYLHERDNTGKKTFWV